MPKTWFLNCSSVKSANCVTAIFQVNPYQKKFHKYLKCFICSYLGVFENRLNSKVFLLSIEVFGIFMEDHYIIWNFQGIEFPARSLLLDKLTSSLKSSCYSRWRWQTSMNRKKDYKIRNKLLFTLGLIEIHENTFY